MGPQGSDGCSVLVALTRDRAFQSRPRHGHARGQHRNHPPADEQGRPRGDWHHAYTRMRLQEPIRGPLPFSRSGKAGRVGSSTLHRAEGTDGDFSLVPNNQQHTHPQGESHQHSTSHRREAEPTVHSTYRRPTLLRALLSSNKCAIPCSCGIDVWRFQLHGRWGSSSVLRYIRLSPLAPTLALEAALGRDLRQVQHAIQRPKQG